jgi:peptidoglycan/xylan/chitin deacetylase (PgdA/CDA1 family)
MRTVLALATGGAVGLFCGVVAGNTPTLPMAVVLLVGYFATILGSVLYLNGGAFLEVIRDCSPKLRGVVLTFDDGPDPASTPLVLKCLRDGNVRATFFVIGKKAAEHPDLIREMHQQGHGIGIHSWSHDRFFALRSEARVHWEVQNTSDTILSITGERPRYFRPPVGQTNPTIARVVKKLGLVCVGWTGRGFDGVPFATKQSCLSMIRRALRPGAILMVHDASEDGRFLPMGVRVLPQILEEIGRRELEVVPLDVALDDGGN